MPRPVFAETAMNGGRWRSRRCSSGRDVLDRRSRVMSHFERTTSVEQCALRATSATARVLLDDPLARVDQDERDVGALGRLERAQLRVVLDPLPLPALAAEAGRVDEHERASAALEHGVDRVARRARAPRRRSTRSAPRSALGATTCRRSAGRGSRRGSPRRRAAARAAAREPGDDLVEQVAGAVAVQRRERDRVAEAEPVELERERVLRRVVDLVREHEHRLVRRRAGSPRAPRRPA